MTPDLQSRVNAVRETCRKMIELADNATPGPWNDLADGSGVWTSKESGVDECVCSLEPDDGPPDQLATVAFIASSRLSTPAAFKCVLEDLDAFVHIAGTSEDELVTSIAIARLVAICETMEALERV